MRPNVELFLIRDSLRDCQETTYFSGRLHTFTARMIGAIDHVLSNQTTLGPDVVRMFTHHAMSANRYLAGSTTKDSPYEIEFCLQAVLPKWSQRDCLIITALTDERDFHFRPSDPWNFVKTALPAFDTKGFDPLLVQLGVPRMYSHKPLYCVPLYHELGHFIDVSSGVSQHSSFIVPLKSQHELWHRMEHFADLFAAAYIGRCSIRALEIIAPNNQTSVSHPSTVDRVSVVEDFLANRQNHLVDTFQTSLQMLGLPKLEAEFDTPSIRSSFNDVRTFPLGSKRELHGVFGAAWEYLENELDNRSAPWVTPDLTVADVERVINDLVEKSIRNASIKERWESGAAP